MVTTVVTSVRCGNGEQIVLGIVLTIAWIILPFALIGTKPLLRQLIAETQRTNELLRQRREP